MTHYSNTANPVDFPRLNTVDRLWGEALDRAVPDTYSTLTWTQVERIKAVFAELIVRECARVADQWVDDEDNGRNLVSDKLRQHFGVGPNVDENLRNRSTYFGNDL